MTTTERTKLRIQRALAWLVVIVTGLLVGGYITAEQWGPLVRWLVSLAVAP
jgi:hypothetical protein